ncbi:hypothetical protein TUN199_12282, partial [Pyrenophora tritici-repentis]
PLVSRGHIWLDSSLAGLLPSLSATERRLRCGPHTLNLIGQMLLWGEEKESYDNEETERVNEAENMATWRGDGPLGVLLAVINYIKTPQ